MTVEFKTSRRGALKTLGLGAAALATPHIIRPTPAWAQTSVVNVTTYDKFLPKEFVEKFQKESGIKVNIRLTDDQAKQYNLLVAESSNPSTDIVTVAGHRFGQFIESKVIQPFDTGRLKNWKNVNTAYQEAPWARVNGNLWGLPILSGYEGLVRNTDEVPGEIDTWGIMFDPKYKGLSTYIVGDMMSITMKYLGFDGDFVTYAGKREEAQKAANAARDHLIKHKGLVRKFYDSPAEVQQMFINQDVYLAQAWSGPAAKLIMQGAPVKLSVPKEGSYGYVYTLNVVTGAPNADNAYKLLDAILSDPEVGAAMTRQSGFASTFAGVDKVLSDSERKATTLPQNELERINFFSSVNRSMKSEIVDKAAAEVKSA